MSHKCATGAHEWKPVYRYSPEGTLVCYGSFGWVPLITSTSWPKVGKKCTRCGKRVKS